ncbi:MAG: helix-turn-helix domain-containing protein [Saprospiraceae bacterium]
MMKNRLHRIAKILKVEPFRITALWTNAETRLIDFEPLFEQWKADNDTALFPLFNFDTFRQVSLTKSAGTLKWENVRLAFTFNGEDRNEPLDLDPDGLFAASTLVQKVEVLPIGQLLKSAREFAGLSQTDVAMKSGTTRNYISRIENGKADIQLETLQKIVQLGIGKQVFLEIR